MTLEEEFYRWWSDLQNLNAVVPHVAAKLSWLEAHQRGLNDGLEQAARICVEYSFMSHEHDYVASAIKLREDMAEAIRAQIKK